MFDLEIRGLHWSGEYIQCVEDALCVCVCVVDTLNAEPESLNNAAHCAGPHHHTHTLSIYPSRLGEMLMMQSADPNTQPAPSRLCQLGQSPSLFLCTSFINPYSSFPLTASKKKKNGWMISSFIVVLPLPFPLLLLQIASVRSQSRKPSMSFF